MQKIFFLILLISCVNVAAMQQTKSITVNKALIDKISKITPSESNAHSIEQLVGPPAGCVPLNPFASESWMCQWKGTVNSNRLENTLNISFESGMIAKIVGIDSKGKYLVGESPK